MDNNILIKFKEIYFSQENRYYIINIFKTRVNNTQTFNYDTQLHELQNLIFNKYFIQIYNETLSQNDNTLNYNNLLEYLNNYTIEKFIILYNNILQNQQINDVESKDTNNPNNEYEIKHNKLQNTITEYNYDIYSINSQFENGIYNIILKDNIPDISSFCINNINMYCNLYNINDNNCLFTIEENKNSKINITIPIGYYNLKDLLICINDLLLNNKYLKNKYNIFLHKNKNKVYFKSDKNFNFYIKNNLLGYSNSTYTNNNNYISETHPFTNIYNNLYIKLYINDKEIIYNKSNSDFTYYYKFEINYTKYFGIQKRIFTKINYYYFENVINIYNIKIEFLDSNHNKIYNFINFDASFSFEN